MAKTKYEKELEEKSRGDLAHMCAFSALAHTGSREELIARLVKAKEAEEPPATEPEPEPEVEPPATEPATEPGEAPPAEE